MADELPDLKAAEKIIGMEEIYTVIGQSMFLQKNLEMARSVQASDATVLLLGETGVGKGLLARAIHAVGPRAAKPFMALNCSALVEELLESELFGYKASDIAGDKQGLIEACDGGTIFLNEVCAMPFALQEKLLRLLETGRFFKGGSKLTTEADVRIISATSRHVPTEVAEGKFKADLLCRLNVLTIEIPPLRERNADIPILADHFLNLFGKKMNKRCPVMSKEFLQVLERQPWKGNVRELRNVIERAMILSSGPELGQESLPLEFRQATQAGYPLSTFDLASVEKLHIQRVLEHTGGNKMEAAKLLNIGLTTIYRKIEEFGLA